MAYDEDLAHRVRKALEARPGVTERKMFGGLAFMLGDAMCCGLIDDDLMARVGPERYGEALEEPGARPMDFTGKSMTGYVFVDREGYGTDAALERWVSRCVDYVTSLPPRKRRRKRGRRRG